jgi:hypothetical protein
MDAHNNTVLRTKARNSFLVAEMPLSGTALVIQGPTDRLLTGVMAVLIGCVLALFAAWLRLVSVLIERLTGVRPLGRDDGFEVVINYREPTEAIALSEKAKTL